MTIAPIVLALALAAPAVIASQAATGAVNAEDQDQLTPLMKACAKGDLKAVNDLLAKGADINLPHAQFRITPIMFAAYFGHLEIVKVLIARGANVVLKDSVNAEAVDWADFDNHDEVSKLLKANGGRPNPFLTLGSVPFSLMEKAKGQ
ncbi:MAG: ankyrin repeat domain-containing protein [Vicinamibacterales bacterium]